MPAVTVALDNASPPSAKEDRRSPMRFNWIACQPHCRGWVSAVGIVTSDTPKNFDAFAATRDLRGATVVLDSSGGSVNDAIALGRRWRDLGMLTTVGTTVVTKGPHGARARIEPDAYCESMCVFMLLSGTMRYVPDAAHVRVHQIWMGDRAEDAKAASYTAQDLMIVERDVGRLAQYTFDMGGAGELLSIALSVPPWEDLRELTPVEMRKTNLVTTDAVADVLPRDDRSISPAVATRSVKPVQDRFLTGVAEAGSAVAGGTRTAEALAPAGNTAAAAATQPQH